MLSLRIIEPKDANSSSGTSPASHFCCRITVSMRMFFLTSLSTLRSLRLDTVAFFVLPFFHWQLESSLRIHGPSSGDDLADSGDLHLVLLRFQRCSLGKWPCLSRSCGGDDSIFTLSTQATDPDRCRASVGRSESPGSAPVCSVVSRREPRRVTYRGFGWEFRSSPHSRSCLATRDFCCEDRELGRMSGHEGMVGLQTGLDPRCLCAGSMAESPRQLCQLRRTDCRSRAPSKTLPDRKDLVSIRPCS